MRPRPPGGEQYHLAAGPYRAAVTEAGATLRELTRAGRPVLDGFGPGQRSTSGRGQVLAPWPNRLRDGRYRSGHHDLQLPVDEPTPGNAIHGLVRWQAWTAGAVGPDAVTLQHVIYPREGYPFLVELAVTYALDAGTGLEVRMEAVNAGSDPCPFGAGFHPYLCGAGTGAGAVDDLVLECPAATALVTDERAIPVDRRPVGGTQLDFRAPRPVGATRLDTCYTDLVRAGGGRAEVRVRYPDDHRVVTVWMDPAFGYVMVFSADTLPGAQRRSALAVEPMSCAPNAFQSGDGLVILEPGDGWSGTWGVTAGT